jgi:iron transport multicopper oxidase
MGQYPDGFRGPLVIHDPDDVHLDEYDKDQVITISDWYVHKAAFLITSSIVVPLFASRCRLTLDLQR